MNLLWQYIRYALRTLVRGRFTAMVVATIGLAIGANTAVFSVAMATPGYSRSVRLWLFGGAALLPIACVNCSNLLLAHGVLGRKELAVRAAMGASRTRIFRMILTESVLLALLGGALGILLAWWGADYLTDLAPAGLSAGIGLRAVWFAVAISVASGILFGLAPALDSIRGDAAELPGAPTPRLQLLRGANLLAIAQVGLAFSLLTGAGLMIERTRDRPSFETALLAVFAIIMLLLAMAGVYAVLYRSVGRRALEIGIRMALGARGGQVRSMVLGEAMLLIGAGSCVGMITGMFASRALLGGLRASATNILLIVFGILTLAAPPARYCPARAASKIEPGLALKRNGII